VDASASFVIVLTTFPDDGVAADVAHRLVDEQLAACVAVLPAMRSIYRWEGRVEEADERQLIIKTTADRVEELTLRLSSLHPYDVPEVLVLPVSGGSDAYLAWVRAAVGG
jgi:periplasmic divalent cation tolerance protein